MHSQADVIGLTLIKQAQAGHEGSLSRLTRYVADTIFVYIYRLTLDRDLAEDLTQDTILYILKRLSGLKFDTLSGFWAWTYRTALSTIQHHYRGQSRLQAKMVQQQDIQKTVPTKRMYHQGALEQLIRKEKNMALFSALKALKFEHRHVLVLRCLNEMNYSQIAKIMGGTELRARLLFLRARHSLKRHLVKRDFDKKYLLTALGLFGHLTGISHKAASAAIKPVAVETMKVGTVASSLYTLTTIPGIVTAILIATTFIYSAAKLTNNQKSTVPVPRAVQGLRETFILNELAWQGSLPVRVLPRWSDQLLPGQQQWYAYGPVGARASLKPIDPQRFFTNRKNSLYCALIPHGAAIDFAYAGPLVDRPGPDVFITCKPSEKLPDFYTVNSSNQTEVLTPQYFKNKGQGIVLLGFDLNSLPTNFNPTTIRIVGTDSTTSEFCFGVLLVLARIHQP